MNREVILAAIERHFVTKRNDNMLRAVFEQNGIAWTLTTMQALDDLCVGGDKGRMGGLTFLHARPYSAEAIEKFFASLQ
jgi:hypothetical protein